MDLDQVTAAYGDQNAKAWLRVIRERESSQDDSAYTVVNGGGHFAAPPWRHPYAGQSAPPGRASGAYQYIPHTWQRVAEALGFGDDFSPINQDLGALFLTAGRGALADVLGGDVASACAKCRSEWTSLPGAAESSADWTIPKAVAVFKQWGGKVSGEQPAVEQQPAASTPSPIGGSMGVAALLQMFGPLILGMIPQVKGIVNPPPNSNASRNLELGQLLINTLIQASGVAGQQPTAPAQPAGPTPEQQQMAQLAAAITAMQHDLELQAKVRNAVITEPKIVETLQVTEIGGGIEKAAERALESQQADKPFWMNPVVWVTVAMLPIMYAVVYQVLFTLAGPYLVSNGVANAPLQANPWYAVVGFDSNTRTGLINLIVGFVFGGVCGIWFGTTVAKRLDTATTTDANSATTTTTVK